jgi:uncharacterized DUF497 family protein
MPLAFEWDQRKADTNLKKRGLSFAEAKWVFGDPESRIFPDADHSGEEEREIIMGHLATERLALVCFTESPNHLR